MATCSVLITTYNAEDFIESTLQSILWQTFSDIEVLIVDNYSQDNTIKIIKGTIKDDARFFIFESKKNLWPYAWLNFLLEKAQWKYIAILDHDDMRHPKKLDKQIDFLEKNEEFSWCWSKFIDIRENKNLCKEELSMIPNVVMHCSLVFRNKWYRYNCQIDKHNDRDFMLNVLAKDGEIHHMQEIFAIRRLRDTWKNISVAHASFQWVLSSKKKYWVSWYEYLYNIVRFRYFRLYKIFLYIFFPRKIYSVSKFLENPLRAPHKEAIYKAFMYK